MTATFRKYIEVKAKERGAIDYQERLQEELNDIEKFHLEEFFLRAEKIVNAVKAVCYPLIGGAWTSSFVAFALGIVRSNPRSTKTPHQRLFNKKKPLPKLSIFISVGFGEEVKNALSAEDREFVEIEEDEALCFMTKEQAAQGEDGVVGNEILRAAAIRYQGRCDRVLAPLPNTFHDTLEFAKYLLFDKEREKLGVGFDMVCYESLSLRLTEKYGLSGAEADYVIRNLYGLKEYIEKIRSAGQERGIASEETESFLADLKKSRYYAFLLSATHELANYLYTMEKVCFAK